MQQAPLIYDAVLGETMDRLAPAVRDFHRAVAPVRYAGRASVVRGTNLLARIAAAIIGLPPASADCAVEIEVTRDERGVETWSRRFGGKPFVSRQEAGRGAWAGLMVEHVGPMAFAYGFVERDGAAHLDLKGWRAFGIPMPGWLGPRVVAFEHGADGRFNFDVDMTLPVIGRLVHYRGWLVPLRAGQ